MTKRRPLPEQQVLRWTYAYDPLTGAFSYFDGRSVAVYYANKGKTPCINLSRDFTSVPLARVLWKMVHGTEPEIVALGENQTDWRAVNLFSRTEKENAKHMRQRSAQGKTRTAVFGKTRQDYARSGVSGVHWHPLSQRWRVIVTEEKRQKHIGSWLSKDAAIAALSARKAGLPFPTPPVAAGQRLRGSGASGVAGVRFDARSGKWRAAGVKHKGVTPYLGTFGTKEEAIAARKKWEEENGAA